MKTCPSCHRPVDDDARTCPHPGCGKPISGGAVHKSPSIRPPPPPRKVHLSPGDVSHVGVQPPLRPGGQRSTASAPRKRRGLRALFVIVCVLGALSVGGYFALRDSEIGKLIAGLVAFGGGEQGARPQPQQAGESPRSADASRQEPGGANQQRAVGGAADDALTGREDVKGEGATVATSNQASDDEPSREPEVLGLYSQRTAARREDWIGQAGGTPASETAVAAGLQWLARHQADDGHWGPDCLGSGPGAQCEPDHACSGPGKRYEAALTGLAVLAFQAGGHYDFNKHAYSENVARGLRWLTEQQGYEGELAGSLSRASKGPDQPATHFDRCYMYEHSMATFALAEACALAKAERRKPDPALWRAAVKGVRFIESQQHDDGGWRYDGDKQQLSDTSVSGWAMLALKTALEAEIEVNPLTISRLLEFFDGEQEPLTGRTHYQLDRFGTDALTGVGMMVDEFVRHDLGSKRIQRAAPYLADQAEANWGPKVSSPGPDYYLWYNCTLAMFQAGGEPWKRWNDATRERVVGLQEHGDGCTRGSWPPIDRWSGDGGRIYATALAVLTLEVYYRFAKEGTFSERPAK